ADANANANANANSASSAAVADVSAETSDSVTAEEGAPEDVAVGGQLADGTGAVAAEALDAGEPRGVEVFAEGSSQFAAVTDEQLAEALAETIEPAAEPADADALLAAEATDDLARAGSTESSD
ncbi:MAG: hypothetical protein JNL83_33510, partial [Myxococcales bacterium]|nr:hypothetical protein [Myxococcales bacterium]